MRTYLLPTGEGSYVETGAGQTLTLVSPEQWQALEITGRTVHITATGWHGTVVAVDGYDWIAVPGSTEYDPGIDARLVTVEGVESHRRISLVVKWWGERPPGGLRVMDVPADLVTPGVSLAKIA